MRKGKLFTFPLTGIPRVLPKKSWYQYVANKLAMSLSEVSHLRILLCKDRFSHIYDILPSFIDLLVNICGIATLIADIER